MVAHHIHDALGQVRRLQELILDKAMFRGYSGSARVLSGLIALVTAAVLSTALVPRTENAHLAGWGIALSLALILNYGALAKWFLFSPETRRDPRMLKPAVDALPALAVGATLSVALVVAGQHRLLFGTWMSLYGLAQTAYRKSLPPGIYGVGLVYILCGLLCLLMPAMSFLNPWPMGFIFFAGELAGGVILRHNAVAIQNEEP